MTLLKEQHAALRYLRLLHQRQLWTPSPAKPSIDKLIDWGAYFIWYFHYMPVGNDASPELLPTPEQRQYIYHQIRDDYRHTQAAVHHGLPE